MPSNISEGFGRNTTKEYIHFLYIALWFIVGLETQIMIAAELEFLNNPDEILNKTSEIGKMLNGLINSL